MEYVPSIITYGQKSTKKSISSHMETWMTQVSNRLHAHAHFPAQTAGRSCLVTAPLGEEEGGVCVHVHQNNLLRTHGPLENAWFVWKPMGRMLK